MDLISYQDNSIQVFYKMKADDRYYEKFSIRKKLKACVSLQNLVFELPFGVKPKNIRIDLGDKENDSIRLVNISFQYKKRIITGKNGLYKSWFTFNQNVIKTKDSLTFHFKRINNVFDPQLNGNIKLNSKLVKLFVPNIIESD